MSRLNNNYPGTDVIAVVPAAGHGSRMGVRTAKQFLSLNGSSVLNCTLERLHAVSAIKKIVLVVAAADQLPEEFVTDTRLDIVTGGATRSESVRNGLTHLATACGFSGSVLVHDAARPCVRVSDIERLIIEVADNQNGGLLAIPVHDTLKRSDQSQQVNTTIDRAHVWRAVTPQLFQINLLLDALTQAHDTQAAVTDEASAMELMGYRPRLVQCAQDNIKITELADMQLAQTILEAQDKE